MRLILHCRQTHICKPELKQCHMKKCTSDDFSKALRIQLCSCSSKVVVASETHILHLVWNITPAVFFSIVVQFQHISVREKNNYMIYTVYSNYRECTVRNTWDALLKINALKGIFCNNAISDNAEMLFLRVYVLHLKDLKETALFIKRFQWQGFGVMPHS